LRIVIHGDCNSAKAARAYLRNAGVAVCDSAPALAARYTVTIEESAETQQLVCDSVPSELETNILGVLHEYLDPMTEKQDVILRRAGGQVRGEREIRFIVPAVRFDLQDAAERAIYLGILKTIKWGVPKKRFRLSKWLKSLIVLALLMPAAAAAAPTEFNVAYDHALDAMILHAPGFFPQISFPYGPLTVIQPTGSLLHITCDAGCGGAASFLDNGAFTAGTTSINIIGGWYSTSPTNCTSGSACAPQLTVDRKLFVQDFQGTSPWIVSLASTTITGTVAVTQSTSPWVVSNSGTFAVQAAQSGTWNVANTGTFAVQAAQSGTWTVQQGGAPWSVSASGNFGVTQQTSPWVTSCTAANCAFNVAQWNAVALGSPSAYGTSPGAVNVPGVNAFVTNTVPVTLTSTTITGTVGVTQSTSPWVVSNSGTFAVQAAQSGTWNVGVNNFPATQAVTGTVTTTPANPAQPQAVTVVNNGLKPIPVQNQAPAYVMQLSNGALVPVYLVEGQATMSQSLPVAIASNQSAIPVTVSNAIASSDSGTGPDLQTHALATDGGGNLFTRPVGLPLQPCNAVRLTNCQHF
jgi:hypothetical protein